MLVDADGPVIIDFPQSVDAAHNRNAKNLLIRDVDNLTTFLQRSVRSAPRRPYSEEIWEAYECNLLSPDMELTGKIRGSKRPANVGAMLAEIQDVADDERERRERSGNVSPQPRRRKVVSLQNEDRRVQNKTAAPTRDRPKRSVVEPTPQPGPAAPAPGDGPPSGGDEDHGAAAALPATVGWGRARGTTA